MTDKKFDQFSDELTELCKKFNVSLLVPFEPHELHVNEDGQEPLAFLCKLVLNGRITR